MFECKEQSGYVKTKKGNVDWVTWYEDFTFEFDSRESYLEFRQWWKESYLSVSDKIRAAKKALKHEQRAQAKAGVPYSTWKYERTLHEHQQEARRLMAAIEAAKKEAGRQMELRFRADKVA